MNVENTLRHRLEETFSPSWLELENESHQHSVPQDSQTHFRLVMVSEAFRDKRAVARHQLVYGALTELLAGPIHALAMHLYDPDEWRERAAPAPASPACLGGSKADAQESPQ